MAVTNKIIQEIAFLPEIKSSSESVRSVKKFIDGVANQISEVMDEVGRATFDDRAMARVASKMKGLAQGLVKARSEGNKELEADLQKQFDKEKTHLNEVMQRRQEAQDVIEQDTKVFLEKPAAVGVKIGEEIGSSLTDVLSGEIGNLGGLFQRLGGHLKKGGFALQARETDKSMSSISKTLGSLLRKLGPTLIAVGAIAAAFTAVVKTIIDADTKMKEMTKTLIDGGAAAGDIAESSASLVKSFHQIADFAESQEFNEIWGTLPEDQARILAAWSEAGFTLREMRTQIRGATSDMQAYQKATAAALTYSKLLGESAEKVATDMAERMDEMGLSLDGIREGFANIYEAAQLSGFGTKRMFGMILQATSGMSMFNVRLEEAAGLMVRLSKVLGKQAGSDFAQSMMKGFGEMSQQDRIKMVKMLGPEQFRKIMTQEISNVSSSVAQRFGRVFAEDIPEGMKALEALGIERGESGKLLRQIAKGGPASLKARQSLGDRISRQLEILSQDPRELAVSLAKMREHAPRDLIRVVENLNRLTEGMSGNIVDQARALQAMGPGGGLAAMMAITSERLGKPIHELMAEDVMRVTGLQHINEQQLEEFRRVSREFHGGFEVLNRAMVESTASGKQISVQRNKEFAKAHGLAIRDGKIFTAELKRNQIVFGSEVGTVQEAIMAQGEALANIPKKLTDQEKLAKTVAKNTLTFQTRIEQYLREVLGKINDTVRDIRDLMPGVRGEEDIRTQRENVSLLKQQRKQIKEQMKGATPEERRALEFQEKAAKALEVELGALETTGDNIEQAREALLSLGSVIETSGGWIRDLSTDMKKLARQKRAAEVIFGKEALQQQLDKARENYQVELSRMLEAKKAELERGEITPAEYKEFEQERLEEGGVHLAVEESKAIVDMFRRASAEQKRALGAAAGGLVRSVRAQRTMETRAILAETEVGGMRGVGEPTGAKTTVVNNTANINGGDAQQMMKTFQVGVSAGVLGR